MLTKKDNQKNETKNGKPEKSSLSTSHTEGHSGCCQPLAKAPNQLPAKTEKLKDSSSDKQGHCKTKITIKYDTGFSNHFTIRGKGANLNWEKGQPLKNVKQDEWVWETDAPFTHCEFKVLINDRVYENGENHQINAGDSLLYTPHFYQDSE